MNYSSVLSGALVRDIFVMQSVSNWITSSISVGDNVIPKEIQSNINYRDIKSLNDDEFEIVKFILQLQLANSYKKKFVAQNYFIVAVYLVQKTLPLITNIPRRTHSFGHERTITYVISIYPSMVWHLTTNCSRIAAVINFELTKIHKN